MFSHIVVGSNDLELSRKFYDATFAPNYIRDKARAIRLVCPLRDRPPTQWKRDRQEGWKIKH